MAKLLDLISAQSALGFDDQVDGMSAPKHLSSSFMISERKPLPAHHPPGLHRSRFSAAIRSMSL
jgi:hypothetical protein